MQLGMIGLGRMGGNMAVRLVKAGHECIVYDSHREAVDALVHHGTKGATDLPGFVKMLRTPRVIWLMVPAGAVDSVIGSLMPLLEAGDVLVDGGNSYYHDDIRRAEDLRAKGLHYVDVGVSGGVWGLDRGFCHMIGGEPDIVEHLDPIFRALAPGVDAAPRTAGAARNSVICTVVRTAPAIS
jgi:6-phosphogluconate dehydrogenase